MSTEIISIIRELENIQERLNKNRELVHSQIKGIQVNDRRITIYTQLFGILDQAKMGFEFSHCSLNSHDIRTRMFAGFTDEEFLQRINAFIHFTAIGMNHAYFSIIESFLRQIHRTILNEPPISFSKLNQSVSKALDLSQWSEFLKFYGFLRNTQHNNGLFLPSTPKNEEVTYRGKKFLFIYGEPIHFLDADLRLELTNDGNYFVYDVCISEKVINYTCIADPSHYEYTPIP